MTWWSKFLLEYNKQIYEKADSRTAEWLLVESPWNPFIMSICYVYFSVNARVIAEKWPTYDLRWFIILYNFAMVGVSAYMCSEFAACAYAAGYSLLCQPVDYSISPTAMRMANVLWIYYVTKYVELSETIVFALRKKFRQISVLHVYHHTSMVVLVWVSIKYEPGGQGYLFGMINSFVHAVMYSYYGLSVFGPHMQKYLWWKKYITILQLSQFVILFFFCIRSIAIDCQYSKSLCGFMVGYGVSLFVLFMNFYVQTYSGNAKVKSIGDLKQNIHFKRAD